MNSWFRPQPPPALSASVSGAAARTWSFDLAHGHERTDGRLASKYRLAREPSSCSITRKKYVLTLPTLVATSRTTKSQSPDYGAFATPTRSGNREAHAAQHASTLVWAWLSRRSSQPGNQARGNRHHAYRYRPHDPTRQRKFHGPNGTSPPGGIPIAANAKHGRLTRPEPIPPWSKHFRRRVKRECP